MIRVDMTAPELDRQIELLKVYPEILQKHFVPVLKRDVKLLDARIRPTIPVLSSRAQRTFGSKVTGTGINLTGRVGWYDRSDPWYPNVIEHGAKAHEIKAKPGGYLRLLGGSFVKSVQHPGFSAVGFMAAGWSAMQPIIEADLARANEGVVNDLALDS